MSLRSINGAHEFSNLLERESLCHSERSRGISWHYTAATTLDPSTSLRSAQHDGKSQTKNPDRNLDSVFLKSYPADAVQADHPFPSVTGG